MKIQKALISVSDKTGIVEFAKQLREFEIEIISTGGTKKILTEAGVPVTDITAVTKNPEAFGGRMKTISFTVESALLFDRVRDAREAESLQIEAIDLVVCNLYPFEKVLEEGADFDTLIENIDIGGPTMVRAAAKNFKYVTVLTHVEDYVTCVEELKKGGGNTSLAYRTKMMAKAFNHTADYDALIAQTMDKNIGELTLRMKFESGKTLRYGENSHQQARMYKQKGLQHTFHDMRILHGKEISYNNVLDIAGAVNSVKDLKVPGCAIVKHSNPCGLAQGNDQRRVLELAWQGDPVSAFGSIIAFNTPLFRETVEFFDLDHSDKSKRKFIEVVIAPKIEEDALQYLQNHKDIRVIEYNPSDLPELIDYRYINGTLLEQDYDRLLYQELVSVTESRIDINMHKPLIEFGLNAIKNIKSNSIAIVMKKNNYYYLTGMGAGQPNRLISTQLALEKTRQFIQSEFSGHEESFEALLKQEMQDAFLISDAFFPFPDNVEIAAEFGIKNIIQPGGSIRDKSVIDTCNRLGVRMLFTHIRHFKH
jgi:phosphoribosylaminoimidazolecarboxamide formyltransferase/IMP cyclohydrolase